MDLEVLEMVSEALAALVANDPTRSEYILRDIVSVYDERMEAEAEVATDALLREKAQRKVSISRMSHPSFTMNQQASK